jgi:2-oxoglutarate ferredoxin oxidoreductase subunit beta
MKRAETRAYEYLRRGKKFPGVWCAGCGIGIVMGALIRAIDNLSLDKNKVAVVSGIGCTGRMPVYLDFNTMHTTHGRALAFATGLKMARPEMAVIAVMGDGDALAIGGNHFIHAARRNIGITAIVVDNQTYGMTGGQASPTTPTGRLATTAPYGNLDQPFPITDLSIAAGAAFVARSTVYHATELDRFIARGIQTPGFAVIEAVSYCHTTYGRINRLGSAVAMMRAIRERSIRKAVYERKPVEERDPQAIVRGIFHDETDKPEYTALYQQIVDEAVKRPHETTEAKPA